MEKSSERRSMARCAGKITLRFRGREISSAGPIGMLLVASLIWHLGEIGLDYRKDDFLSSVVDMAVVTELRDIKYRGRILVKDGMTL